MARRSICFDQTNESLCDVEIIAGTDAGTGRADYDNDDNDDGQTGGASPILATNDVLYDISHKWKEFIQSARKTVKCKVSESVKDKIFIPQISREIMDKITDFVYAGLSNKVLPLPLDDENVGKYFEVGKFLDVEEIEAECLKYFDSKIITLENFSVLFKWASTFGKEAIQPKMRAFLTQQSQQVPEIMRRCKNELEIPEAEIALVLIDWLSFCSREGENCDLDVEQIIQQFSEKNEKTKLLKAFRDSKWSKTAFNLLVNLYEKEDSDSEDTDKDKGDKNMSWSSDSNLAQHQVQNPTDIRLPEFKIVSRGSLRLTLKKSQFKSAEGKSVSETRTVSRLPKSNSKSSSFFRAPSKRISKGKSGPNPNSNACQPSPTPKAAEKTSEFSAPPGKKQRIGNASTRSSWNSVVAERQIENDSDHSSSSSWLPLSLSNASTTQRKIKFDKNNKLAQNSNAEGIIYFLLKNQKSPGGFHFWSFNLKTKKSAQEAQLPPSFRDRRSLAMVYWKNTIYFMAGYSFQTGRTTKKVDTFDLKSKKWTKMDMINPRYDFGACVLGGNIYAVGGCEESPRGPEVIGNGINSVEMLSFAPRESKLRDQRPKWEHVDCMESCRAHAGIVTLDRKIYAIGGEVWNDKVGKVMSASNLCKVFDPKIPQPQDQWNPIAPMKFKRLGLAAVATTDQNPNRIYALGGTLKSPDFKSSANPQPLNTVEIYDPDEDSWENGPPMKKPRKFFSAVYFNNCIYALGGDSKTQPTMEKFDLGTRKWTLEGYLKKEGNFATVAFEPLSDLSVEI